MTNVISNIVSELAGICIGRCFELLEPCEVKVSCTVLRGEGGSNIPDLLDKPSDLEQRAGRLIRQGNENLKVKVFRYVTENTFDSYLWQLVENKQRFISQIMTSKSPVRSAEDVDESTLSYAEIKALATGNPLIKEKMDLDVQVSKLYMMKANYLSNKYMLEDKIIKCFPNEIKRLEDVVKGYKKDIQIMIENTIVGIEGEKVFNDMTINGVTYGQLEKENAGKALLNACKGIMSSGRKQIGDYRGFNMELSYDSFFNQFNLNLKGALDHIVTLGSDVFGNITRIDNMLDHMNKQLEKTESKLEGVMQQLKNAKIEVDKPFEKENEYKEKAARLSELDHLLSMGDDATDNNIEIPEIDIAKELITDFMIEEYDTESKDVDFANLKAVDIAYTTTEDGLHEIQTRIDLENYKVNKYVDEVLVHTDSYGSFKELIDYELRYLNFEELVYVTDEEVEMAVDKEKSNKLMDENDEVVTNSSKVEDRVSILQQLQQNRNLFDSKNIQENKNNVVEL